MPSIAPQPNANLQSYAAVHSNAVQEVRSARRFEKGQPQIFTLQQRHFVVGGQHLALEENPKIAVYPGRFEFEIVGWGLSLPYGKQNEIGREMVRKFLSLFGKAERLELTEHEEAEWATIVKQVDYKRFSIERSPHRYVEGKLLNHDERGCRIQWHDGTKERLVEPTSIPFAILEPGERFRALAKFGKDNVVCDVVGLVPMPAISGEDAEAMWQEWPEKS